MKKVCNECKLFEANLIRNCLKYEVNIPDMSIAEECKYFNLRTKIKIKTKRKIRTRRKRCNKCEYMIYDKIPKKNKYFYRCSKLNITINYLTLKDCNLFKHKNA